MIDGGIGQLADVARNPASVVEDERAVVDEHAHELLDEERVALGGVFDAAGDLRIQLGGAEEIPEQRVQLVGAERLEEQALAGPAGTQLEQVGARERQHEHRRAAAPADEVLDEVEQRRLGPVQVLEDEHEGTRPRDRLEELSHGPEDLLGAHVRVGARASRRAAP